MTLPAPESEFLVVDGRGGFYAGCWDCQPRRKWHGWWVARRPPRDRVRLITAIEHSLCIDGWESSFTAVLKPNGLWFPPDRLAEFHPENVRICGVNPEPVPEEGDLLFGPLRLLNSASSEPEQPRLGIGLLDLTERGEEWPFPPPEYVEHRLRLLLPQVPKAVRETEDGGVEVHYADGTGFAIAGALISDDLHPSRWAIAIDEARAQRIDLALEIDCEDDIADDVFAGLTLRRRMALRPGTPEWIDAGLLLTALVPGAPAIIPAPRPSLSTPAHLTPIENLLRFSAADFITRTADGHLTIMAGYPWFTDWGRDTMIALPGLCLAQDRREDARTIIRHFLQYLREGLIPNLFPEHGHEPEYNTVDATLWLVEMYFRTFDLDDLRANPSEWAALKSIITAYHDGTRNNIHADTDGLIIAGTAGTQLTWMDVKVDGHVPTPRHGKAVEIQGLWYNALLLMAGAAEHLAEPTNAALWRERASRVRDAFAARFIVPDRAHLADVVDRDGANDIRLRPNQVIPFALANNIIPEEKRADVLRSTAADLLTPRGLRTLARSEPEYKAIYRGNVKIRDRAYHQGTVWMWLLWPYVEGILKESARVPELAAALPQIQQELTEHLLEEACLGHASEIFDGDPPHHPRGCFAQAWSLSAIILILRKSRA